jgi:hypothetical protein
VNQVRKKGEYIIGLSYESADGEAKQKSNNRKLSGAGQNEPRVKNPEVLPDRHFSPDLWKHDCSLKAHIVGEKYGSYCHEADSDDHPYRARQSAQQR